jgi:hypothetical protein
MSSDRFLSRRVGASPGCRHATALPTHERAPEVPPLLYRKMRRVATAGESRNAGRRSGDGTADTTGSPPLLPISGCLRASCLPISTSSRPAPTPYSGVGLSGYIRVVRSSARLKISRLSSRAARVSPIHASLQDRRKAAAHTPDPRPGGGRWWLNHFGVAMAPAHATNDRPRSPDGRLRLATIEVPRSRRPRTRGSAPSPSSPLPTAAREALLHLRPALPRLPGSARMRAGSRR